MATLDHVRAGYRGRTVLDDVSVELTTGLTFLVGENGAGKTTLFRVLLGLLPPAQGVVTVGGVRFSRDRRTPPAVSLGVGYLPQQFLAPGHMRLGDFLMYVAWLRCVPRDALQVRARRVLADVGLEEHWSARIGSLSGGMFRRAGVAQALVHEPSILLLDEPTVGLDPTARAEFRGLISALARDEIAVVCSTHLLEDAAVTGGAMIALQQGRVVYSGTTEDLLAEASDAPAPGMTALETAFTRLMEGHR